MYLNVEAISGKECKIARNYLTSTLKNIVMQMRNGNCEKGYCIALFLSDVTIIFGDVTMK